MCQLLSLLFGVFYALMQTENFDQLYFKIFQKMSQSVYFKTKFLQTSRLVEPEKKIKFSLTFALFVRNLSRNFSRLNSENSSTLKTQYLGIFY